MATTVTDFIIKYFASDEVRCKSLHDEVKTLTRPPHNLGNYENAAQRLDNHLSHNSRVDTFVPGEVINLLHIKDHSKPPKVLDGKPAEIIIRLVPKGDERPDQSTPQSR